MIGNQADFHSPEAVAAFQRDRDEVGLICDEHGWYITPEVAGRFQTHLKELLPLASAGIVSAQYAVASMYMLGYIYSSEADAISHHEVDSRNAFHWLEKAASAGHLGAIDNLLAVGTGETATRLRDIYREHATQFEQAPAPSEGWERNMKKLYELAYGMMHNPAVHRTETD